MNEILKIPFAAFVNDWDDLQLFLKHKGNPPYEITDDLKDYMGSRIQSLGNLTSVGGNLNLYKSKIEFLRNLTSVGGYLDLYESKIKSLGNLTSVGGSLDLSESKVESLGNLTSVGGSLNLSGTQIKSLGNLTSVGGNLDLRDTPLSKKYTKEEIRKIVKVGNNIIYNII
jgi:hypothetical protein